jgi:hypothetical protein
MKPDASDSWSDWLLLLTNLIQNLAALLWTAKKERFIWIAMLLALEPASRSFFILSSSASVQRRGAKNVGKVICRHLSSRQVEAYTNFNTGTAA